MKRLLCIIAFLLPVLAGSFSASAQFKEEAFNQSYNDDPDSPSDSTDVLFSFKELFGGIAHKNPLKPGTMLVGSVMMPGTGQIYNKDYWKLPIVYAGLAGGVAGGFYFKSQDNKKAANLCFAAAGLTYWGMMLDDITYQGQGAELASFNIYFQGELVGSVAGDVTTYTVAANKLVDGKRMAFDVTAVYTNGVESLPATAVITITTDIRQISADGQPVDIYTIDGRLVRSQAKSLDGLRGVYVVNGQKYMLK